MFFFFFLIIDFLISGVIAPIFNPIAKLVISIANPNKEARAQIEIYQVTSGAKIRKC